MNSFSFRLPWALALAEVPGVGNSTCESRVFATFSQEVGCGVAYIALCWLVHGVRLHIVAPWNAS